ncbi:hypothetical protein I4U23_006215 [Adineta vaga]|nr:hypothetical protein I4U23_006215 [Adineta vaga]
MISIVFSVLLLITRVQPSHYKGGTITWKPVDPYTNASLVQVIISEKHSWTLSRFTCDQTLIDTLGYYDDIYIGGIFLSCLSSSASCSSSLFQNSTDRTFCTDFSQAVNISTGSLIIKQTLSRTTNILIGFTGLAWADVIIPTSGTLQGYWSVMTRIDLTKTYPINSSPVTGSLPIIRVIENRTAIIQIPAADWDVTNTLRCRWATSPGAAGNECDDICNNLIDANLSSTECTLTWYAVRRPIDITRSFLSSTYVAAIMVEDFIDSTSTVPLSSVPLQMLIFTYIPTPGACYSTPLITGDRPNRACIGVPINVTYTERIVATVYCAGDYIIEFITTSPLYMKKTAPARVSGTTNQWFITLTWTPIDDQKGPQVFCAAPIDQNELTGPQHCINYVVGYAAPNLIRPSLVQGTASPVGTVFSNHSIFSISATGGVYHPNRNGTYIQIFNQANPSTPVWQVDCGHSSDVIYTGQTVSFIVRNPNWIHGALYYILFDSGAASGNVFCAPESDPIYDPTFWTFNIWNPARSSTTTTTTTPFTTNTVITRPISTTTPLANLTTTGIIAVTSTTQTTTTTTTTTSTTESTTTTTTQSTALTTTEMNVISSQELITICHLPITIGTIIIILAIASIRLISLYILFTKLNNIYNPNHRLANARRQQFQKKITPI